MKNDNQLFYLKKVKKFYNKFKSNFFDPYFDTPIYLATYSGNTINSNILNKLIDSPKNFLESTIINLKDFLYASYYSNYKILENKEKKYYENIVVTWAYKKNFKKDGSLEDRFLNFNSKKIKKTLWFVIYLDKNPPKKFDNNLFIYQPFIKKKN